MIRGSVIISQLLISAQLFDSRKRLNMEPAQQAKSTQKNSSQGSQGHRKKRPSLFPIRNSARRKSSMSETKSIFDPHDTDCNSNRLKHNNAERDHFDNHQTKSETQFEYRTPSGVSDYSSPRTSKSSPKDFVADTPFVPFVHQSITKTVWQSEQVIPEEKEDLDRKQSQTQMVKNNELDYPIKQQKEQKEGNILCHDEKDIELYPSLELNQNQNNAQIKIEPQEEDSNFQTCIAVSIAIPPEQTYYTEQTSQSVNREEDQMKQMEYNPKKSQNYQIDINVANENQNISSSSLKNPQEGIKSENPTIKQETYVEDVSGQFQLLNQIQHHQYVSKASIYQKQSQEKNNYLTNQFQSLDYRQQQMQIKRKPKLSFSYIECISIRTIAKPINSQSQQTTPKLLQLTHISPYKIPGPIKIDTQIQIQQNKLEICNPLHSSIKSTKKQSSEMQTTYAQRLQAISKSYDEKIGIPKIYAISSQQTENISKIHSAAQTDKIVRKNFGIKEELNLSICYNYGEHSDAKLNQLENFIKNLYGKQQAEIQQMKNRRSIDMSINTEDIQQNGTPHSHRRKSEKDMRKFVRDAYCQYDTKDLGANRPSLKRVSIAAAPIIHQIIDDSNSTQTFEQMQAKKSSRGRPKGNTHRETKGKQMIETKQKQIKEQRNVKLEGQRSEDEDEMYIPPTASQTEQVKKSKSKRKASKTPKKKNKH